MPGHGSFLHDDNAVTKIAEAVARLGNHRFPLIVHDTVRQFLDRLGEVTGLEVPADDVEGGLRKLGPLARIVGATVRDTINPTMLKAGYKANVIPSTAEAVVDCRFLPGREEAFLREVDELLGPDVTREWVTHLPAVETPFEGALVDAMAAALAVHDPDAHIAPYMLSGGTDAKSFARWACGATASRRCGCRPIWTSRRCSTASTSGCRWTRSRSARGCSPSSCRTAELRPSARSQAFALSNVPTRAGQIESSGSILELRRRRSTTLRTPPG